MCLSIPGKLVEITAELDETFRIGKVDFDGIHKEVCPKCQSYFKEIISGKELLVKALEVIKK